MMNGENEDEELPFGKEAKARETESQEKVQEADSSTLPPPTDVSNSDACKRRGTKTYLHHSPQDHSAATL